MTENEKFDLILAKLDKVDGLESRFVEFGEKLDKIDRLESEFVEFGEKLDKVDGLESRFGEFGEKLDKIDRLESEFVEFREKLDKIDGLENEFGEFRERLDKLDNDVAGIKLTLENEIRTNIMRVAEGHQDLYRRLREATKIEDEKEMIAIRVNILETELRTIKERLDQIA